MAETMEIRNAIIKSATIIKNDRCVLTAWLHLDYGSCSQSFGGYLLYSTALIDEINYAGYFIWRVMAVVGVDEWGKLNGKIIRVKSSYTQIIAIGNAIEDIWFYPKPEFDALRTK